mmetsp:Transcript_23253/g.64851  ORF Transcript_23253/g.64851 Transcript_23253/m.64851 type:complete len:130 (+) Transcript_23253:318-707(+)
MCRIQTARIITRPSSNILMGRKFSNRCNTDQQEYQPTVRSCCDRTVAFRPSRSDAMSGSWDGNRRQCDHHLRGGFRPLSLRESTVLLHCIAIRDIHAPVLWESKGATAPSTGETAQAPTHRTASDLRRL